MSKIISKGHKSVRSRVANISDFLSTPLSIEEFRALLLKGLYAESEAFESYYLTEDEWKKVHELKAEKYDNWDWNYGRSPKSNIERSKRFAIGEIDLRIFVEKGLIADLKIFGDFFGKESVSELESLLQNVAYDKVAITKALENVEISSYFGALDKDDFINLVYDAD